MGRPEDARDDDDDTKNPDACANKMGPPAWACLEGREAHDVGIHRPIQDLMARRYSCRACFIFGPIGSNALTCIKGYGSRADIQKSKYLGIRQLWRPHGGFDEPPEGDGLALVVSACPLAG
jgi:hypothetical protein